MQEDIEQRSMTLAINTTKLTGRVLKSAITKFLAYQKGSALSKPRTKPDVRPQGKQSVKELVGQNQGAANIEINNKNIKDFDRVARKYNVDYAVKKDRTTSPPRYLVFFKARDSDAITAAFKEYTANTVRKQNRPSILQMLRSVRPQSKKQTREKKRERSL